MNRLSYRIIFNTKRGQLVAVAECTSGQGKSCGERAAQKRSGDLFGDLHAKIRGGLLCATAFAALLATQPAAWAQVIADPNAPANQRPTVLTNTTGGPLVNIQTPSAAGVSRNTYSQFDVGSSQTVVLNNNRFSNPWLATGSARVILNEVNSSNPSNLAGQITVDGFAPGGARTDVVFANPSGININGVSFFGAGRVTMTTGAPVVTGGALTGFNVTKGNIDIASTGMAVNGAGSFADLISRSAVIGGVVRADQAINVVTGPQSVDYATGVTTPLTGAGTKPALAIDTKALGGMYAGSITLLSTEAGVGVRNQGTLQANTGSGQLIVTADGRLENTGRMDSAYTSVATVAGNIDNSGKLLGRKLLMASAGADFNHSGDGMAQNEAATSPLTDSMHTAYNIGSGMAQDTGSASQVFINAKQDVKLIYGPSGSRVASNASVTAADGTVTKGQVVISAGRNVGLSALTAVNANGAVQISSGGNVYGSWNSVRSAGDGVSILAKNGISLSGSSVEGNTVHLETGAAFEESVSHIAITGGSIIGKQQTAVIATGDLNLSTAGTNGVKSTYGSVFLNAGKNITLAGGTKVLASKHLTASAAESINFQGISGAIADNNQVASTFSGGDTTLTAGKVVLQGGNVEAWGSIEIEASKSDVLIQALPDQTLSTHTAFSLNNSSCCTSSPMQTAATNSASVLKANNGLSISAYNGGVFAKGLQASGSDVSIVSNGVIQIDRVENIAQTKFASPLKSNIIARGDLTIGSIHENGVIELLGSTLTAAGQAKVIGNGAVNLVSTATNHTLSDGGKVTTTSRAEISGAGVVVQGGSVSAEGLLMSAKNGHASIGATSGDARLDFGGMSYTEVNATGNVTLHANKHVTVQNVQATAGKNLAVTSATGTIASTSGTLAAKDMLSLSSKGAQTHVSSNFTGGAMSVYNQAGALTLNSSSLKTIATTTTTAPEILGQLSVESGGSLSADAGTRFDALTDLSIIAGSGDIRIGRTRSSTVSPTGFSSGILSRWFSKLQPPPLTYSQDQIKSGRGLTIVARNGDLVFAGHTGSNGYNSSGRVSLTTQGDMTLVANNIALNGTVLRSNGTLNLYAAVGNLRAESNAVMMPTTSARSANTYWDRSELHGGLGINVVAARDLDLNGLFAHTGGVANFQSGGNLTVSGKINRWQVDNRPSAGSSYNGWFQDEETVSFSYIQGFRGVNMAALGGHLRLNGADVYSGNGAVALQALGDVRLEAAMTEKVHAATSSGWKEECFLFICKEKTWTTYHDRAWRDANPLTINARDISIKAGGNVATYAARLFAGNNLRIEAGGEAQYWAVKNESESSDTTYVTKKFIGVRYDKETEHTTSRISTPSVSFLYATNGNLTSYSGGDQLFQGTDARYQSRDIHAGGTIILEGVVSSDYQQRTKESNYVVWQKRIDEGSYAETLILPKFTGPDRTPFSAAGGLVVQVPAGDLTSQIQTLSQQPGMSYLNELAQRKDVDWRPVKLAHEQWSYKQEGLTPAGAALLGAAVAWATGGMGAELLGTTGATTSAMANAAFMSLSSQAAITLVNNKGNIGKTLSDLAKSDIVKATIAAALTAGVLDKIGALDGMQSLKQSTAFTDKLTYNLINAGGRALTNTAINGGNLEEALKHALVGGLVDTAHGEVASKIKLAGFDYLSHKLAHALAGCVAGAASSGTCRDGAIGAAVGEVVAEMFKGQKPDLSTASDADINAYREKVVAYSKIVAGAVSAYAGGDAQTAITTAETAVRNNYLNHYKKNGLLSLSEVEQYNQASAACQTGDAAACGRRDSLVATSLSRDRALSAACGDGPAANPVKCNTLVREARSFGNVVNGSYGGFVWANSPNRGFALNVSTVAGPGRPATFQDALARSTAGGLALVVNGPEDLIVGAVVAYGGRAAVVAMEGAQKVLLLPGNLVIKVDAIDWTKQAFMPGLPPGAVSGVNLQTGEIVAKLFGGQVVSYGNKVELAPVLKSADNSTVWVTDITVQGQRGENLLGRQDRGIGLHPNEAVIDVWDPINGLAVSQKTLNWNASSYANNASAVERQLKTYVDQLAAYQGTGGKTLIGSPLGITSPQINSKALEVVLPSTGGSQAHVDAVNRVIDYARLNGIDTKIYKAN